MSSSLRITAFLIIVALLWEEHSSLAMTHVAKKRHMQHPAECLLNENEIGNVIIYIRALPKSRDFSLDLEAQSKTHQKKFNRRNRRERREKN